MIYPESQCGFHASGSNTYIILTLRLLLEKCREQGMSLCFASVDLTNYSAFWRRSAKPPTSCLAWCYPSTNT
ncbi:hypothetical protein DPMN_008073 [Dreissena polymorpha]|uniref:Uncharacterized protein n=1 Tax=Dreissena polymorpha TaxID=45954 RepID=A0A9D4RYT7_DREPO|nr:hypothetical protein DPMN_008073 [Dreissena polymorpha]